MSKLVDKERLAKLAAALDERAKAAVKAEEDRAIVKENAIEAKADANVEAIAAINNEENGILAQAKADATSKANAVQAAGEQAVADEKARAETKEAELLAAINALNGDSGTLAQVLTDAKAYTDEEVGKANTAAANAQKAANDEKTRAEDAEANLQTAIDAINNEENGILKQAKDYAYAEDAKVKALVTAEQQRADDVEKAIKGRLDDLEAFEKSHNHEAIEGRLDDLEALHEENGVVDQKIAAVKGEVDAVEERMDAAEGKLNVIQGAATVEGSIAKAEADAKAYADEKIAALVDSAPDAMNTLNELAKAINDNKDVYDGYVEQHAQAMAQQKDDLQDKIDADVKVVADELANEKDATKEGSLAKKIADEISRAQGVENNLAGRIAANEALVADQPAIDQEQDDRIAALEAKFDGDNSVADQIKAVADDLAAHKTEAINKNNSQDEAIRAAQDAADAAQDAADAAQVDVDAVVDRLKTAEGEIDALQAFMNVHSHADMETDIAANAKAIEDEVKEGGARDAAIAAALEDYSTTADMKTILGNVVNSLALTMENDQVVLKLGGVNGIALTSVSLDMATNDDIDAIIAGLDAEE